MLAGEIRKRKERTKKKENNFAKIIIFRIRSKENPCCYMSLHIAVVDMGIFYLFILCVGFEGIGTDLSFMPNRTKNK